MYPQRWAAAPAGPVCVALWGVADPGNVGTVLRSALAFGAASVAIGPGSADPYAPKAVRASMGALFSVPVARVREVGELPGRTVALAARAGRAIDTVAAPAATHSGGASPWSSGRSAKACRTTLSPRVTTSRTSRSPRESLNAAMAATVALYAATRPAPGGSGPEH